VATIGVDAHKRAHHAVALDSAGRVLGSWDGAKAPERWQPQLRWAIESGFETMKAWGWEQFMVRQWVAIDRLLWWVALAYALATLALYSAQLDRFRTGVIRLLKQGGAFGRRLTVGKLAEAVAVDFRHHRRAVLAALQL
jgi:hypothetical protein